MTVTVESFRDTFSEYRSTDDAEIQAKLTIAQARVGDVWGVKADAGVLYLTAHLLALAPAGQNAKLKPENAAKTVYGTEYKTMLREVTFGLRTAGLPNATEDPFNG